MFKDISHLELWRPLCSGEHNHVSNLEEGILGTILLNYSEFGLVVQEEMLLKDNSYLELWRHFCSMEQNHLRNNCVKLF